MEPQINSKKIITPVKLFKYLAWTAFGWGVLLLISFKFITGESYGFLILYAYLGIAILVISSILAFVSALRSFSSGDKVSGYKFLALIIVLPAIGLGIGCGTVYVASTAFEGLI